jgi:hypothetical protein
MSLSDLYPPIPTELDPYLGLTIDAVPDNLKEHLKRAAVHRDIIW